MIGSFGNRATEDLYRGLNTKHARRIAPEIRSSALRKLDMIDYADALRDLAAPPANRLKPLKGRLKGYHSIRINDRWRIIFRWRVGAAYDVEIADYH